MTRKKKPGEKTGPRVRLATASSGIGFPALWQRTPDMKRVPVIIAAVGADYVLIRLSDGELRPVPEQTLRWPELPAENLGGGRRSIAGYQVCRHMGEWQIWDGETRVTSREDLRGACEWIAGHRLDIERVRMVPSDV